uniref:CSON015494 protein n=1 Tax=Culicoides sonorensis TaxID=179676 RepID=A0A336LP88_CULSO
MYFNQFRILNKFDALMYIAIVVFSLLTVVVDGISVVVKLLKVVAVVCGKVFDSFSVITLLMLVVPCITITFDWSLLVSTV